MEKDNDVKSASELEPVFENTAPCEEAAPHEQPLAPDGGWGWVVVVASFIISWNIGCMLIAFSLLYVEFTEYFQADKGVTGWIGSFYLAVGTYFGVIFSVLLKHFGCRVVALVGCALWALGYALSSLAMNVAYLYITYGLISGMGYSMALLASVVAVQQYFSKRRAAAAGIAASGISTGALCSGPLMRFFLDTYGWRGTLLIMAGMVLHGVALGMLYFPIPSRNAGKRMPGGEDACGPDNKNKRAAATKQMIKDFFDFSLFYDHRFVLVAVGTLLMNMGMMTFYQHMPSRATFYGVDEHQIALLPMFTGIATAIARVVFGFVANIPRVNRVLQYGISIMVGGILGVLYFNATTFTSFTVFGVLIGAINGCFLTVQPTMLVDLMGVDRIARSQAFVNIFQGTGSLIGVPLAGYIVDKTGNYNIPFFVLGSLQTLGGILVVLIVVLDKCCKLSDKKNKKQTDICQTTQA